MTCSEGFLEKGKALKGSVVLCFILDIFIGLFDVCLMKLFVMSIRFIGR